MGDVLGWHALNMAYRSSQYNLLQIVFSMMETAWTGNRLTNKIWGDNVIEDDLQGMDVMSVDNVPQHEDYQNV